jgi:predicted nucleic acid-binding protein
MAYLLDTVTVSEFRDKTHRDPAVFAWQSSIIGLPCFLSVITLHEIRFGIRKVARKDPGFAATLANWYDKIVAHEGEVPFLAVDRSIAELAAEFRAMHETSFPDSLIAATVKIHGLTLATRNTADFVGIGIDLVNPWEFKDGIA